MGEYPVTVCLHSDREVKKLKLSYKAESPPLHLTISDDLLNPKKAKSYKNRAYIKISYDKKANVHHYLDGDMIGIVEDVLEYRNNLLGIKKKAK